MQPALSDELHFTLVQLLGLLHAKHSPPTTLPHVVSQLWWSPRNEKKHRETKETKEARFLWIFCFQKSAGFTLLSASFSAVSYWMTLSSHNRCKGRSASNQLGWQTMFVPWHLQKWNLQPIPFLMNLKSLCLAWWPDCSKTHWLDELQFVPEHLCCAQTIWDSWCSDECSDKWQRPLVTLGHPASQP